MSVNNVGSTNMDRESVDIARYERFSVSSHNVIQHNYAAAETLQTLLTSNYFLIIP